MNMRLKMSSVKWRPFCLSLNVLRRLSVHLTECRYRMQNYEMIGRGPMLATPGSFHERYFHQIRRKIHPAFIQVIEQWSL